MAKNIYSLGLVSIVTLLACDAGDSGDVLSTNAEVEDEQQSDLSEQEQWAANYFREMQTLVDSFEGLDQLNHVEELVSQVEAAIVKPWVKSWKTGELNDYDVLFAENASSLQWHLGSAQLHRDFSGIQEYSWVMETGNDTAKDYLSQFSQLEDFSLKVVHLEEEEENRVLVTLEYDLRGVASGAQRQQDRGHITMRCQKTDSWKITSLQASTMERLKATRAPAFVDYTENLGLNSLPISDRKEAIRRGGYALVVADYDNDGLSDMLVGNYGPINLLRNTGSGFEDVTAAAGLDPEEVIKGAGFVDMDNDGDRDIVLLRFTDSSDLRGDFVVYENSGDGKFVKHVDLLPRRRSYDTPMPLSMGDYNNDGFIDIYIGFPGMRDFTSGISTQDRPDWQASQGIWFNQGNWNFVEADDDNAVVSDNDTYSHAAASTDLDGDGWIDLLIVDDSGRINPVFRNSGSGNFEPLTRDAGLEYIGTSMGVTTGDFNNDGHLDIMASHVAMNAAMRMASSMYGLEDSDSMVGRFLEHLRGSYFHAQLFQNNGDGTFTDITGASNLQWTGEAASAGEWLDYNHDGLLDFYLPNGLWSSGEDDIDSLFYRAEMLLHGVAMLGVEDEAIPFNMMNDVSGGAIFTNVEEGGVNPVLTLLRNHRESSEAPLSFSFVGHQRNALFRNNGDGTFTEVGFLEGADRIEDGYIVAPVDFDGDGLQDMVLRNTDPAPEQSFQPVIALKNQLAGNSLTIKLQSEQWNTDGLGARVTAHIGNQIISREIRSVSGAVQAEPVAYFGLGDATSVDKIVVTWPGGAKQEVLNVEMGTMTIARVQ